MAKTNTPPASTTTRTAQVRTSGERFLAEITELFSASVNVLFVRAKEPYRALRMLHDWSLQNYPGLPFRHWDSFHNWMTKDEEGNQMSNVELLKLADPTEALARIGDLSNPGANNEAWEEGLFVMMDMQKVIGGGGQEGSHTPTVRVLQEYTQNFVSTKQRLVLLMPETFMVPPELQASIPTIDLGYPTKAELREELEQVLQEALPAGQSERAFPFSEMDTEMILDSAAGLTTIEACNAFSVALIRHGEDWRRNRVTAAQINAVVLETKTQVLKASEVLERMESVPMEEIGGLELFKEYLSVLSDGLRPEARAFGVDSPKGFLLVGPPGTGKSMGAKATASFLRLPLVRCDMSKFFAGIVGQSEGRMRAALKQIEAMQPCVVLLDEIDKAGLDPRQTSGDSGVGKRVLGGLLTFMAENKLPIVWVLTANRTDSLPPEMLRKGRLDEAFAVLLPTKIERLEILRIHLRKRRQPDDLAGLEDFAEDCEGYIGAELESIVQQATLAAFRSKSQRMHVELLRAEKEKFLPQSVVHRVDFAAMEEWAEANARPTSLMDAKTKAKRDIERASTLANDQPKMQIKSEISVMPPKAGPDFKKLPPPRKR